MIEMQQELWTSYWVLGGVPFMGILFSINMLLLVFSFVIFVIFHLRQCQCGLLKSTSSIKQELKYIDILRRFHKGKYNKSFAPDLNLKKTEKQDVDIFENKEKEKRNAPLAPYETNNSSNKPLVSHENEEDRFVINQKLVIQEDESEDDEESKASYYIQDQLTGKIKKHKISKES